MKEGLTKRLKIFFVVLFLSLPFWWGINVLADNLENLFLFQEISKKPGLFSAELSSKNPLKQKEIPDLEISAGAAFSLLVDNKGNKKVLYKKNSKKRLPIASISKLMTALIVLDNFDLSQTVIISPKAVSQPEDFGNLKANQKLSVKDLLFSALIESSNDAAYALSEVIGKEAFVDLMNLEADYLGLKETRFFNPTGIDSDPINYSTTEDLAKLTVYLLNKHPLIWEILSLAELEIYDSEGNFHHKAVTTNEFLKKSKFLKGFKIIGGKTGETPKAGGCLCLVLEIPQKGYLINIILNSDDRFGEMEKMIDWLKLKYKI